jgi:hypothetical protein
MHLPVVPPKTPRKSKLLSVKERAERIKREMDEKQLKFDFGASS